LHLPSQLLQFIYTYIYFHSNKSLHLTHFISPSTTLDKLLPILYIYHYTTLFIFYITQFYKIFTTLHHTTPQTTQFYLYIFNTLLRTLHTKYSKISHFINKVLQILYKILYNQINLYYNTLQNNNTILSIHFIYTFENFTHKILKNQSFHQQSSPNTLQNSLQIKIYNNTTL
jgi:hypothetical protein